MIYTLRFLVKTWIVPLIARVISAYFCNYLHWNMDRGPCWKYEMTWWHYRLHKYRRYLMEAIVEIVLLRSGELTSGGWSSSGELIFSGEENRLGNVWTLFLLGGFPRECLREILKWEICVLILAWVRFWSLQMPPLFPLSPDFEGK